MGLQYDFGNSIGYWITSASHSILRALNDEVRPHGITSRQCHVLGFIALYGPLAQAELAEHMGIEPPTLVGILDRMERSGWITRKPCPHDRRKKEVWATPAGEPIWEKIVVCAKAVRHRATQGISPSELALLKQLLHRVQSNLEQGKAVPASPAEEVA